MKTILEKFISKVNRNGPIPPHRAKLGKCHVWTACKLDSGYGKLGKMLAHRASVIISDGGIPDGLRVLHKCDNPSCVRRSHLFVGTDSENLNDCVSKKRHAAFRIPRRLICLRGHRYSKSNTPSAYPGMAGRYCKQCASEASRRCYARKMGYVR